MRKGLSSILKQGWPYALAFYFANKLTLAFVIINSDDIIVKLQNLERALPVTFVSPLPSMRQEALLGGLVAVFFVFFMIQNAKDKRDTRPGSENTGRDKSFGQSFQRMGRELLSKDEIASMDGGKCIVQIKGCRPFFSKSTI